jgi:membrane protein YdbS with pleckstrin-like domain
MASRYIIEGTDQTTGRSVRTTVEATSIGRAEEVATSMGVRVLSVELEGAISPPRAAAPVAADAAVPGAEQVLWQGNPSQWENFWWFVGCITVILIPVAIWKWLNTRMTSITLTSQRLKIETGVVNRSLQELELYRVRDTALTRSFIQRIVNLGTVELITTDTSTPTVRLSNLPAADDLRETLRRAVEQVRRVQRVREVEIS